MNDQGERHSCARVASEARDRGWDRSAARNQAFALKRARDAERGAFRGQDMSAHKFFVSFGERHPRIEPERIAWRIGHHAGRLFALREIRYDVEQGTA